MSSPDKPKSPAKPFLDNEELSNDLDAWDATFDALHGGPEAAAESPAAAVAIEPAIEISAPAARLAEPLRPTPVPEEAQPRATDVEVLARSRRDRHPTIDPITVIAPAPRAPTPAHVELVDDPAETDFSTVGAAEPPSALGAPLGSDSSRGTRATTPPLDDDDDVFTSASRPPTPVSEDFSLPDEPVAPPVPVPMARTRTSPAIIRRTTPVAVPQTPASAPERPTPPHPAVLDDLPDTQRRADARSKAPTAPPPLFFSPEAESSPSAELEDDYADIEIDASAPEAEEPASEGASASSAPASQPPPPPRRTVAHVVRRPERPKTADAPGDAAPRDSGPISVPLRDSEPVIEVSHEHDVGKLERKLAEPARPNSEDDFSDVAAAVGNTDELGERIRPASEVGAAIAIAPSPPSLDLDSALHGIDDDLAIPHEDVAAGDVIASAPAASASDDDEPESDDDLTHDVPIGDIDELPSFLSSPPGAPGARRAPSEPIEPPSAPKRPSDPRAATVPASAPPPPSSDTSTRTKAISPSAAAAPQPRAHSPSAPQVIAHAPSAPISPAPAERPPGLLDVLARPKRPSQVPALDRVPALADDPETHTLAGVSAVPQRLRRLETPLPIGDEPADVEPSLDLEAIQLPEQVQPLPSSQLDEELARMLEVCERELTTVDESAQSAALRIEAGRLCERLGELERARTHYDAALLADPRATAALRGLRRLARASSDLVEAVRQLDDELTVAGALERRPLAQYRVDLLLASGEQDLARVAAGEILDSAPSDVRALLAQLELAFLDGRADEFGRALEQLAQAVGDNELRAAVQSARGVLAAHKEEAPAADAPGAATWFAAAAESDPASLGARLGAIREAAARADGERTALALLDLARQVEASDPTTAAALALRAQRWATGATAAAAATLAQSALPSEPLVARAGAETALASGDPGAAAAAMAAWAQTETSAAERAYAAARAAELDPVRGVELWSAALLHDPGDDYAAAQLRTGYVTADATQLAIDVDHAVATDGDRERARLRAAFGMIGQGQLDAAIELLEQGHAAHPGSLALTEAYAEALAAGGRWSDRAKLLDDLALDPGEQLDREVAQLRSALAWEEAVGAASSADPPAPEELQRTTAAALGAWDRVIEAARTPAPAAQAAAIVLATRLGDSDVVGEVLARAQAAESSPWAAGSVALRRARLAGTDDDALARGESILRDAPAGVDDPRRTTWMALAAARRGELNDASLALEERARVVGQSEAGALRLRAAQLALDTGNAARAAQLLGQVESDLPTLAIAPDLLAAARRRSGDRPPVPKSTGPAPGPVNADAFGRVVRDGDLAASHGDGAAAVALYQRALELRPGDPLAALPLLRVAIGLRDPGPITALALAQLRAAESANDTGAKTAAYEQLAFVDKELRSDTASAQIALESASQADPSRVDLLHRLEREYTATDQLPELFRLRRAETDQLPLDLARDRAALVMDAAALAERDQRPDEQLADLYRGALGADPRHRLALLHLESIVRRGGASPELAGLEDQIATYFDGDPRTQAAFYTRAGETLAEIGQIDAAVQKFGTADEVLPGHAPALEGWRAAALKGELWNDVAQAATRQAQAQTDAATRAARFHFAGVVLMDKAMDGARAMEAFRSALAAEPAHKDAFIRLRILLEEDANHDELAIVLANRLDLEPDAGKQIELHRALAELHRNFLDSRDIAKTHYRAILDADPNDLRAHAAVADIAWEQGNWQEAAEALMQRARLEHDRGVLTTLCYRLGLIYADRLNDPGMALKAFQRALSYQPDDENTLVRLADLATQTGDWKLALGACERLVKAEQDPDKRAAHLHRVARIFKEGFGDRKRAERALNLALDGAPTNDEALTRLVEFYRDAGDMASVRVHLNRVAGTMRVRVAGDPQDGVAYRVIARAMAARSAAGVDGSVPVARAAAELATLLGAAGEPERHLLDEPVRVDLAPLLRPEADDVLFPRTVQTELRQLFKLLGDRIAKHVGVDLRGYGVGRGDRLRAKDSPVAALAQDVASGLGFGEIDVYVSARQPYAMVAEPTSPVSLVIGQAIANTHTADGGRSVRFAAGAALKLAQASLAIPARLPEADLGVLVVALLRLFQTDFPQEGLDEAAIAAQAQKLRRLIPNNLMNELRPFALAIDAPHFRHEWLARDLRVAGLRAGLVAAGSLQAGLAILAAAQGVEIPQFLADPIAQGLISFALGEDHAALSR